MRVSFEAEKSSWQRTKDDVYDDLMQVYYCPHEYSWVELILVDASQVAFG